MHNNKLVVWIKNCFEYKVNNESIFIQDYGFNFIHIPRNINIDFINLKIQERDFSTKFRNSIITNNNTLDFQNLIKNNINGGFIFIKDKESIKNLISGIETKNIDKIKEVQYISIEPINVEELLTFNKVDLERFISDRENILKEINEQYNKLCDKDLSLLLEVYYTKKILIASFAQRLFRLAVLNFISSEKEIGTLISNILGTSSKSLSHKYIGISCNKKVCNTRVYDIHVNQIERDTKTNIANNLVNLNLKELDIKTIAKITVLPVKIIEKLYKKVHLK